MSVNKKAYRDLIEELTPKKVTLVAVSKTKTAEEIKELYDLGQRDFGENYVQEVIDKQSRLPTDIRWHFIGHLQTNKVKQLAPFVQLIHGVDSLKLLKEINKEGEKNGRVINCLFQIHIAQEETKFGFNEKELNEISGQLKNLKMDNVQICGLMGMASFTDDKNKVRIEFRYLKRLFDNRTPLTIHYSSFNILSMGMSSDYKIAIEEGSNMIRAGTLLFGERKK